MQFAKLSPVILALALAACGDKPAAPEMADPDAKPGLLATDGMLVLPAVKGNPGAAYFNLTNSGDKPAELAAISIEGAGKAEMHETKGGAMEALPRLPIKPGESIRFEQGARHVMVFDLADTVQAGGSVEMTLTFSDGDKVSAPLMVESIADMADHDHR